MATEKLPPIHPGEILLKEFLEPLELSAYRLAEDIDVAPNVIEEIVRGEQPITREIAKRLSEYFKLSKRFWMNVQEHYDRQTAQDARA